MFNFFFTRLALSILSLRYHYEGLGGWRQSPPSKRLSAQRLPRFPALHRSNTFTWASLTVSSSLTLQAPVTYRYGFNKAIWPSKDITFLEKFQRDAIPKFALPLSTPAPFALDRKGVSKKTALNVGLWVRWAGAAPLLPFAPVCLRTWPETTSQLMQIFSDPKERAAVSANPDLVFLGLDPVLLKFAQETNPSEPFVLSDMPTRPVLRKTFKACLHNDSLSTGPVSLVRRAFFLTALRSNGRS